MYVCTFVCVLLMGYMTCVCLLRGEVTCVCLLMAEVTCVPFDS